MKGASTGTSANGGASKEIYDDRWGKTEGSIFNMQQAGQTTGQQLSHTHTETQAHTS